MMPPRDEPPMDRRGRLSRRAFVGGVGTAGLGLLAGCGRWPWQAPAAAPLSGMRLELLKSVAPEITYVAVILNPTDPQAAHEWRALSSCF
jgi:hypothetical protein